MSGLEGLADQYNHRRYYRELNFEARAAYRRSALQVGDVAPAFELADVDGTTVRLPDSGGRHTLLLFGCYSAGPCVSETPAIDRLAAEFRPAVRTLFVYTREGHPGEALRHGTFPRHEDLPAKAKLARQFRDDLGLTMSVCVDDLRGSVHRAYGLLAFNAALVRADGVLVHREEWASAEQLHGALANLRLWDERRAAGVLPRMSYSESIWCMERLEKKP
jgi:peroxiredoxin